MSDVLNRRKQIIGFRRISKHFGMIPMQGFRRLQASPATTFANYEPMGADGKQGLTTTITRETEGYPNTAAHGVACSEAGQ